MAQKDYRRYFKTVEVSKKVSSEKKYRIVLENERALRSLSTCAQALSGSGMAILPEQADFMAEMLINRTARLVAKDLRTRYLGPLKFSAIVKGSVEDKYAQYDPEALTGRVIVSFRKGYKSKIDFKHISLHNRLAMRKMIVHGFASEGIAWNKRVWVRGKKGCLWGENLRFAKGDQLIALFSYLVYERTGEAENCRYENLNVVEQKDGCLICDWPEELNEAPAGTEVQIVFKCHTGRTDGKMEKHTTRVILVEEDTKI